MKQVSSLLLTLAALLIAAGISAGGHFVGSGLAKARLADRYVTVKGLAEREVMADLVIWPLSFNVVANNLAELQAGIDAGTTSIRRYLREQGFEAAEITNGVPLIEDFHARGYGGDNLPPNRYAAQMTVILRSRQTVQARASMQKVDALVKQGIALIRNYEMNTEFLFTDLNAIKPDMIAEATGNARRAAGQFAEDSGSEVGAIRKASQGFFSISDLDRNAPHIKTVRVVTTVEYFLENRAGRPD